MAKRTKFNVALCDALQLEYCRYKRGEEFDRYRINRILRYSEGAIITNVDQLSRIHCDDELKSQEKMLRASGLKGQSVEELASKTAYKIVLSDSRDDFPYVNIINTDEPLQPVLGGCFFRNRSRDKAVRHIASLCAGASSVLVYDKYLMHNDNYRRNMDMLVTLLPDKALELVYHPEQLPEAARADLLARRPGLTFREEMMPTHHDRYIVVDGQTEIILTSGLYHLTSDAKEITYIVRRCTSPRFA